MNPAILAKLGLIGQPVVIVPPPDPDKPKIKDKLKAWWKKVKK